MQKQVAGGNVTKNDKINYEGSDPEHDIELCHYDKIFVTDHVRIFLSQAAHV